MCKECQKHHDHEHDCKCHDHKHSDHKKFKDMSYPEQASYLRGMCDGLKASAETPFERQAAEALKKMSAMFDSIGEALANEAEFNMMTGAAVSSLLDRVHDLEEECGIADDDDDDDDEVYGDLAVSVFNDDDALIPAGALLHVKNEDESPFEFVIICPDCGEPILLSKEEVEELRQFAMEDNDDGEYDKVYANCLECEEEFEIEHLNDPLEIMFCPECCTLSIPMEDREECPCCGEPFIMDDDEDVIHVCVCEEDDIPAGTILHVKNKDEAPFEYAVFCPDCGALTLMGADEVEEMKKIAGGDNVIFYCDTCGDEDGFPMEHLDNPMEVVFCPICGSISLYKEDRSACPCCDYIYDSLTLGEDAGEEEDGDEE